MSDKISTSYIESFLQQKTDSELEFIYSAQQDMEDCRFISAFRLCGAVLFLSYLFSFFDGYPYREMVIPCITLAIYIPAINFFLRRKRVRMFRRFEDLKAIKEYISYLRTDTEHIDFKVYEEIMTEVEKITKKEKNGFLNGDLFSLLIALAILAPFVVVFLNRDFSFLHTMGLFITYMLINDSALDTKEVMTL